MLPFGKLPFEALQHYVGYWGYSGPNADVAFGPLMPICDIGHGLMLQYGNQLQPLASLGVVEIERSAGHAERFNTRSMDRAGRE